MCGICGIMTGHGGNGDREINIIEEMKLKLYHRGPDDDGTHVSEYAVLGHQRLAIIDLDHGQQPMSSSDGRYVLIYNGEIYNYIELRQQLIKQGVKFRTSSDTEVLLQMLIIYRQEAMTKLNGMFAFTFLDTETGDWIMARDHFGIKPLYYAKINKDELLFASEIKALFVHPEVNPEVNITGLDYYFTFQFCLKGETLFRGIHSLEPGHYLKGNRSTIQNKVCYWEADFTVDEHHTEQYFLDEIRYLLEDSAKLQIRSDVPIGTYLSGGLDSSIVTCMAAKAVNSNLPVFTGKFLESQSYDESSYARIVAKHVGAKMYEIVPSQDDFIRYMPEIIRILDEPVAGPGIFPQFMVCREAAKHVKVLLGGQGGDELFGGYARYLVGYLEQALKGAIYETQEEGRFVVALDSIISNLPLLREYTPLMKNFWKEGLFGDMDARYFRLIDRSPDITNLLSEDTLMSLDREKVFSDFQDSFNHLATRSYINKMTHFDFKTLLPALLQVEDRVGMASSLESRVPLLDIRLMNLVGRVPPAMKFGGGRTKALLKATVSDIVPDKIIKRKDKMGFPVPLNEWMRGGVVRDFVNDILNCQASRERGLYKQEALSNMVDNQSVGGRQLWGALSLELWHQAYIDG